MSFINKVTNIKRRPKSVRDIQTYTGLKYPSARGDLEPGLSSFLNFNVVENVRQTFRRDRSTSFGTNAKHVKTIELYMPSIVENLQNEYTSDRIGFIGNIVGGENLTDSAVQAAIGQLENTVRSMGGLAAQAAIGYKNTAQTSTVFYDHTNTRSMPFIYTFEPRSEQDVKNVIEIINTFRKFALPSIEGDISRYPKFWAIEEKLYDIDQQGTRQMQLFKFGPCALVSVRTGWTPDQIWKTFKTGDPIQIELELQFQEIYILSQQDIEDGF